MTTKFVNTQHIDSATARRASRGLGPCRRKASGIARSNAAGSVKAIACGRSIKANGTIGWEGRGESSGTLEERRSDERQRTRSTRQ